MERVVAMKRLSHASAVGIAAAVILSLLTLASCARKVELDEDFQGIVTYSFGESREPLMVIQDRIRASHGNAEERLDLELQLAELLKREDTSFYCKDFACRQLRVIGTAESVPALAKLLTDEKLSDMARYALELNTDPKVDKELISALRKAQGNQLIGIINSLGERRAKEALEALEPMAASQEADVAAAAKEALSKIQGG